MFRSEINCLHENQEVCLKVFPPQITAGEPAVAQLELVGLLRPRARKSEFPWNLVCEGTQLGTSPSFSTGIPVRFDQPGRKSLVATSRGGPGSSVLARTDLIVHDQVNDEIEFIVRSLNEFSAGRWFQSILARHHDDPAYKEKLDLILCQYVTSPTDPARKTAFSLLVHMHRPAMKKVAARYLKRDEHGIEDIIQEATRGAWRSLIQLEDGKRFGPWFHTAVLNACRDAKKANRVQTGAVDPETRHYDQAIAAIDARDTLDFITSGFDPGDVEMLRLRHGVDKSYLDIARALNIQPDRPDPTRVSTVSRRVEKLTRDLRTTQDFRGDTNDEGGIA